MSSGTESERLKSQRDFLDGLSDLQRVFNDICGWDQVITILYAFSGGRRSPKLRRGCGRLNHTTLDGFITELSEQLGRHWRYMDSIRGILSKARNLYTQAKCKAESDTPEEWAWIFNSSGGFIFTLEQFLDLLEELTPRGLHFAKVASELLAAAAGRTHLESHRPHDLAQACRVLAKLYGMHIPFNSNQLMKHTHSIHPTSDEDGRVVFPACDGPFTGDSSHLSAAVPQLVAVLSSCGGLSPDLGNTPEGVESILAILRRFFNDIRSHSSTGVLDGIVMEDPTPAARGGGESEG